MAPQIGELAYDLGESEILALCFVGKLLAVFLDYDGTRTPKQKCPSFPCEEEANVT